MLFKTTLSLYAENNDTKSYYTNELCTIKYDAFCVSYCLAKGCILTDIKMIAIHTENMNT